MVEYHRLGRIVHLYMYQMLANHAVAFNVGTVTHQTDTIFKIKPSNGIHSMETGNQGMHLLFN
jgi:hypothetical protein